MVGELAESWKSPPFRLWQLARQSYSFPQSIYLFFRFFGAKPSPTQRSPRGQAAFVLLEKRPFWHARFRTLILPLFKPASTISYFSALSADSAKARRSGGEVG